mgnify:CR=1 FL=1
MSQEVLLSVKDLRTEFFSSKTSSVTAIKDVSFDMYRGEVLGLVGESGCGKSVTSLSIMQLLKDTPGKVTNGSATLDGVNLVEASDTQIRDIRGGKMSMIFQEPMSALNPSMRIDKQMIETIRHCDKQNVPIATNLASAEMFILGLQRGDLDWREMVHSKTKF